MQAEHSSVLHVHGSFTDALLNHDPVDYSEWYTSFMGASQAPPLLHNFSHSLLPSMLNNSSIPTHYYTEQGLARLVQQHHHAETPKENAPSQVLQQPQQQASSVSSLSPCLPTTLPLPIVSSVTALGPSGSPILPSFMAPSPIPQPIMHPNSFRQISIPEFTYTTNGALDSAPDSAIWQLPEPLHRNYYTTLQFRVPSAAYATTPGLYSSYESYRVYIHPDLGYSGNAKRFKQAPEAGEKAFMLEGSVLDSCLRPITQCAACEEYFENKSYFVANPHCKGRILLIKNNQVNRIKNNIFSLHMKPMCCSRHHQSPFYFHFVLRDTVNYRVVMSTIYMSHVKQWKKTNPTPNSSSATTNTSNKRRKTSHSRSPSSSPPGTSSPSPSNSPSTSASSSAAPSPDISISGSSTPPHDE